MSAFVDTATAGTLAAPPVRVASIGRPPLVLDHPADATPTAAQRRARAARQYRVRLIVTDVAIVAAATVGASLLQLGAAVPGTLITDPWVLARIPLATALTWLAALAMFQTRDAGVAGTGVAEYRRVAHATGLAFGVLALAFVLFPWEGLRGQVILALPLGLLALLVGRRGWRQWLISQRSRGDRVARALVVGRRSGVESVLRTLARDDEFRFLVVGTALEEEPGEVASSDDVRPFHAATPEAVARAARETDADTVIVASDLDDLDFAKRLSWQLEGAATDLVLVSRMRDVAQPRLTLHQVAGLPVVQVRIDAVDGVRGAFKRLLDLSVAGTALLFIALLTPLLAAAIALDSRGPVFFRQRRVGRDGTEFDIVKFRTMRASAEVELAELRARNEGAGPLFKLRDDPRVTRVGAVLRRYSLDELPQFWNVLRGEMSVVGPRPPLPSELAGYDGHEFRRLRLKPGITGLWQVSGRSDLSWDESIRLDLHYVENWSVTTDLSIIFRTAKAMVRPKGAY